METIHRIANKAVDRLTGFDISKRITSAIAFDFKSRNEIENNQKEKFEILKAKANLSEFYTEYQNACYSQFPIMTRENFMKNVERLKTGIKPYKIVLSSGSTSNPVTHYITKEMLLAKRVSHQKMLTWYGLNRESSEFKIGGLPTNLKMRTYYILKNKRYFNSYSLSQHKLTDILKTYNRFKPKLVTGYPSAIEHFFKSSLKTGMKLHSPELIITHAENLYADTVNFF
ncbi:MAG: hypothetical protein HC906_18805 [Bacteroidales bacterium]|nr:hypothetical protein [Bacteroidales bacterium]